MSEETSKLTKVNEFSIPKEKIITEPTEKTGRKYAAKHMGKESEKDKSDCLLNVVFFLVLALLLTLISVISVLKLFPDSQAASLIATFVNNLVDAVHS